MRRTVTTKPTERGAEGEESKEEDEAEDEDEDVDTVEEGAEESLFYQNRAHGLSPARLEPCAEQMRQYVGFGLGTLPPPRRRTSSGSGRHLPIQEGIAGLAAASADAADATGRLALRVPPPAVVITPADSGAGAGAGAGVTFATMGADHAGPPSTGTLASVSNDSSEGGAVGLGQVRLWPAWTTAAPLSSKRANRVRVPLVWCPL